MKMNMPGFTAEATLYNAVTSYRSNSVIHTEIGSNVTPQLWMACYGDTCFGYASGMGFFGPPSGAISGYLPWPGDVGGYVPGWPGDDGGPAGDGGGSDKLDRAEKRCRGNCYTRFSNNTARLRACLEEC